MIETLPDSLSVIVVILLAATLMLLALRRLRAGVRYPLRPLAGYAALREQTGRAVESGRQVHITLGRAPLPGVNGPTSVAALEVMGYLARQSGESGLSPRVTMGDSTLLPAAQGEMVRAQTDGGVRVKFATDDVQFLAANDFPMAYAAGVTNTIHHGEIANNVAVGRFGTELAVIAEAARREGYNQVIGTDDPTAMALATLYSDKLLLGEEMFSAGAYLEGKQPHLASVRAQDILRWLVAGGILLATILHLGGMF